MAELLPCPFCGSTDIELSIKRTTYPFWYTSMYCKKCNCYGARTKVTVEGTGWVSRDDIVNSENTKQIAIKAWNTRTPKERGEQE